MWEILLCLVGRRRHVSGATSGSIDCKIRNVHTNELLYVGTKFLDSCRRLALTWTGADNNDPAFEWEILPIEPPAAPAAKPTHLTVPVADTVPSPPLSLSCSASNVHQLVNSISSLPEEFLGRCKIRHRQTNELLYVGSKMLYGSNRHALTWTGAHNGDPAMLWDISEA